MTKIKKSTLSGSSRPEGGVGGDGTAEGDTGHPLLVLLLVLHLVLHHRQHEERLPAGAGHWDDVVLW